LKVDRRDAEAVVAESPDEALIADDAIAVP
jgi:hypothetical protein